MPLITKTHSSICRRSRYIFYLSFFPAFSSCSILVYARNIPSFIPIPISDTHTPLDIAIIVCPNSCIIKLIIKTAILKKTTKPAYCFDIPGRMNNHFFYFIRITINTCQKQRYCHMYKLPRSRHFCKSFIFKDFSTSKREFPKISLFLYT